MTDIIKIPLILPQSNGENIAISRIYLKKVADSTTFLIALVLIDYLAIGASRLEGDMPIFIWLEDG